jgi:hypothetical protein
VKCKLVIIAALLALFCKPHAAEATCGTLPYYFINGTSIVDATTTNTNNSFLIGCATSVDNTQVGTAGFFPAQIIPTSATNGTFSSMYPFSFTTANPAVVPLAVFGANAQTADMFDVSSFAGATKYVWIDSTGALHAYLPMNDASGFTSGSSTYGPNAYNVVGTAGVTAGTTTGVAARTIVDVNGSGLNTIDGTSLQLRTYAGAATANFTAATGTFSPTHLGQNASNTYAEIIVLASGSATWTFATAYAVPPICTASGSANYNVIRVNTDAAHAYIASSGGTDAQAVYVICIGNPY